MCGTILGSNSVYMSGSKELETFVDQFCREAGFYAYISNNAQSTDSASFAVNGIPSIGLSRGTSTAEAHTCRDTAFPLGDKSLRKHINFSSKMIERVANSVVLPTECGMPTDIKEKLDRYFQRGQRDADKK